MRGRALKWVAPGLRGVPDRIVLLPGTRIFFAELKAPGEAPKPWQVRVHAWLRTLGFQVYVIDSKESVDRVLEQYR